MNRVNLIAILILSLLPLTAMASNGEERNNNDKGYIGGSYSFTINQKCEVNVENVVDDIRLLSEPILLVEWTIDGIATLKKDGTGQSTFRALRFISERQTTESMLSGRSEGTCDLIYDIQKDRSFTGDLICNGTNSTGKSFTTSSFLMTGSIAKGGQTIILSDTDDLEETIDVINFGFLTGICGRSGTAVKIHKGKDY